MRGGDRRMRGAFGNGEIEMSARANLQLRGVRERTCRNCRRAGARRSARRRSRGRGGSQHPRQPVWRHRSRRERRRRADRRRARSAACRRPVLRRLPAKFGFLVDGGGALPLGDVEADIRFEATREDGAASRATRRRRRARASAPPVEAATRRSRAGGERSSRTRRARRRPADARARASRIGAKAVFARRPDATTAAASRRSTLATAILLGDTRLGAFAFVGVAPPFGRIDRRDFSCSRTRRGLRRRHLRLAPWRALLVAGLAPRLRIPSSAPRCLGLIVDPADPRFASSPARARPPAARVRARARATRALGVAAAGWRAARSACQRLRQGLRARCDRGVRWSRPQAATIWSSTGAATARAPRPADARDRRLARRRGARLFARREAMAMSKRYYLRGRRGDLSPLVRDHPREADLARSRPARSASRCASSMPAAWSRRRDDLVFRRGAPRRPIAALQGRRADPVRFPDGRRRRHPRAPAGRQ